MTWRDVPATVGLGALTLAISGIIFLTGSLDVATIQAGFLPARISADLPGFALPWLVTPLTATLVHGSWMHLLVGLVALGFCGREVERAIGGRGMIALYVIGAFAAAAGQWLVKPDSMAPLIGASGAISAVVAAYALLYGRRQERGWGPIPANIVQILWLAIGWIGIQLLIYGTEGNGQSIAVAAHIAGFLAGLALARPLLAWRWRGA